jgi:hypothetical protein
MPASRSATAPRVLLDGSLYALTGFARHMTHVSNFVSLEPKWEAIGPNISITTVVTIWEHKLCAATSSLDPPSLGHRNAVGEP